jgi:hypothetical protein
MQQPFSLAAPPSSSRPGRHGTTGANPASAAQREATIRSLPAEGAVTTLGSKEQAKLHTLASVLHFHARDDVYLVQVIDVPQAWTGLHGALANTGLLGRHPGPRQFSRRAITAAPARLPCRRYALTVRETKQRGCTVGLGAEA